jgi:glycosyltransferase involved in cell wall biosynthesis
MVRDHLYFLSPRDVRRNRADAVSTMKSCREFARNDFQVTLVTPQVQRGWKGDASTLEGVWDLYGLSPTFKIIELPTTLREETKPLIARAQKFAAFSAYFAYLLLFQDLNGRGVVFSHCYIAITPALLLKRLGIMSCPTVLDVAVFEPSKRTHRWVARNVDGVVLYNDHIHAGYRREYGVSEGRIHHAPFPSQYEDFVRLVDSDRATCRADLGFKDDETLVMYCGKITPETREVEFILQAAALLRGECRFVLVGLSEAARGHFERRLVDAELNHVEFRGFQPLVKFYRHVSCADVLLSYYDSSDPISVYQRVPAKATVYACAGRPVICSDLPSMRECFPHDAVYFVAPNRPSLLAEQIRRVLADPADAQARAARLLEFAKRNTFAASFQGTSRFLKAARREDIVESGRDLASLVNGQFGRRGSLAALGAPGWVTQRHAARVAMRFRELDNSPCSAPEGVWCEIPDQPYCGQNPAVLEMVDYLARHLDGDLVGAYVHGSLGTYEEVAYSDFDALVIIRREVVRDSRRLARVATLLNRARSIMLGHDPLQHHGWFVLPEGRLQDYPEHYLPIAALRQAKSMLSPSGGVLRLRPRVDLEACRTQCSRLAQACVGNLREGRYLLSLYRLKSMISGFLLLPTLFLQARAGEGVFKRDSFHLAKPFFPASLWTHIDQLSKVRDSWPVTRHTWRTRLAARPDYLGALVAKRLAQPVPPRLKGLVPADTVEGLRAFAGAVGNKVEAYNQIEQRERRG